MVAVKKFKLRTDRWLLNSVLLVMLALDVHAAPSYSAFTFSVSGSNNSFENGLYLWGNNHGENETGTYYRTPPEGDQPFIHYHVGLGWVLENGVNSHSYILGNGLLPTSTSNVNVIVGTQESSVSANVGTPYSSTVEPVNIINGGMFFDEPDFGIAGVGFNLEWARAYNSALNTTNGLGFRWSHNYDWSLTSTTNIYIYGNYTNAIPALHLSMGSGETRILLKDDTTNIWRSAVAPPLTVALTATGEYFLPLPSGYSCLFGTNGFIKVMSNSWDNTLAFSYTNIAGSACLARVMHSDGRALSMSYSSNRIIRVDTPSTNLYYLYSYNTGGELTGAVTRSSSGDFLTTYAYDTNGVHAILQHQNALGEVAAYAYQTNASGQLTPKCIKVDVATNYYEHTVAYDSGKTTVTYTRGNSNAVYHYYFGTNPSALQINKIDGPNDTNTVKLLNYDSLLQAITSEQNGIFDGTTNEWQYMSFNVSNSHWPSSSGYYSFQSMFNGKGQYTNANHCILEWNNRWELWNNSMNYYMTNVGAMPQDGNVFGDWYFYDNVTIVPIAITNYYTTTTDQTRFGSLAATSYLLNDRGEATNYWQNDTATSTVPWSFTWDTNWNRLSSSTDPEGRLTQWDYTNGSVNVERLFPTTNQPVETHYSYSPHGVLASITNANGHWVSYQSDAYGNPTQTISQAGTTNWMTWDILGHLTGIILPSHQNDTNDPPNMIPWVISFNPNELGWVRQITYPDNTYETFAFDAVGNVTNHVDVAGRTNRFTWLPTRKLASTVRYLTSGGSNQAATVGLDYDQQMNVVNVKDELGRGVETYQLDLQDRPTSVTNVENQVMSMTWGLKDMVSSMVRFDASSISFVYDEGARVKQITYSDDVLSFTYFKNGLPKTASNCWGTISNTYDGANRLTSQTQPVPSGNVAYGYYPAGQVSNVVSVAGTNTYALDAGDRLQTLTVSSLGRQDAVTYSSDPVNGTLTGASYSNGIHCAYSYDSMDRLTGISWADVSNKVLRSRSYTYTAAGLISDITFETSEKAIYSYDSLDRLTREKHTDYYGQVISDEKYDYDLAGNRTKKTVLDSAGADLVTVNYSLAAGNKLGSWTVAETNLSARFAVIGNSSDPIGTNDRFGQLWVSNSASAVVKPTVSGTNFFAFDLTVGMGTQYVHAAIRDVAGNTSYVTNRFYPTCLTNGTYQYSAAGCLTNRQYSGKDFTETLGLIWNGQYQLTAAYTNGVLAESFGYDGAGRRIFIVEGGVTNWMVYDGNQVVAEVDGAGSLKKSYVYEGLDRAISMTTYGASTNTYYFIRDHLGSTMALTDGIGNIIESYRYDAWGRVLGVYNASGNQIDESAFGNRILWQGREYSFKTGLYYFRARWYDPITGRFLSNDPIGISGGLNQYVFCGNNPVNFRDPFGLCKDTMRELSWWEFNVKTPARNIGRNVWNTVTDPTVAMGLALVTEGFGGGLAILSKARTAESFFEGTTYTPKVLKQMQGGAGEFHSFPESVRAFESAGSVKPITGADGVVRQMLEIPGSYSTSGGIWNNGVFQFIKEAGGSINHRLFVPTP